MAINTYHESGGEPRNLDQEFTPTGRQTKRGWEFPKDKASQVNRIEN
jgi:hypothetical protein